MDEFIEERKEIVTSRDIDWRFPLLSGLTTMMISVILQYYNVFPSMIILIVSIILGVSITLVVKFIYGRYR